MRSESTPQERVAELVSRSHTGSPTEDRGQLLAELLEIYEHIEDDPDAARDARQAFLRALHRHPTALEGEGEEEFLRFIVDHIKPEDFELEWEDPDSAVRLCEILYSFPFTDETTADAIKNHVENLLRHALRQFESRDDMEKVFELFQRAPTSALTRGELIRLRNRAYGYEMRRVWRNRQLLYGYLIVQIVLVMVIFPLLFIYAENGAIRDWIEQTADATLPEEERQSFSYPQGVYWSIITAASIGYGDITPRTVVGRVLASILGVMGVITAGVIAGLVLKWITPRMLD